MTDLWGRLKEAEKPIWLYGMGDGADKILNELNRRDIAVSGVFASDGFVRHQEFRGFTVVSYAEAKNRDGDIIVLLSFGTSRPEVLENIQKIAAEQELYAPDVPVIGGEIFDLDYARRHRRSLERVFNMLGDEQSRLVFSECVRFRLSGEIGHLRRCESDSNEAWSNIIRPTDNEHFVDLGAFTGDTVDEFLGHVGDYSRIYAVEPTKKSFSRLEKRFGNEERISLFNLAVSDGEKQLTFNSHGGRNHAQSEKGDKIDAASLDSLLSGRKATLIKMDVEGGERAAIFGARQTILTHRPKMQIACYHRTEDYFSIPLAVADICGDYTLYMRHFGGLPCWDTNFYFI